MNNVKKDRFLYIPHIAAVFHAAGLIYGLFNGSPYSRSPVFYGTMFYIILSLFLMSKSYPHHLAVDYGFFMLLVVITIFFLEMPQNVPFVLIFSFMMIFKIHYYCFLMKEDKILLIILTSFIILILFEAKRWLARLHTYQVNSMKKLHIKP